MNAFNPSNPNAVAVFTKYPRKGQVKTRLAAGIGAEKACHLHTKMTYHALNQAIQLQKAQIADCLVFFHGASEESTRTWLEFGLNQCVCYESLRLIEQVGKDLGARMYHAFEYMYIAGYKKMLLMGTDCPEINAEILKDGLNMLSVNDVVFGPSQDGGYYLLGMNALHPFLFKEIPWSREDTLYQSLLLCERNGISYALLTTLCDIDRPEDISHLAGIWNEFECHHSSR